MPINSFSPPRIVIDTNSPAHAESSPHVRRTLDINRESDIHAVAGTLQTPISIHALRKESDPGTLRLTKRSKNFNPHSPCGERQEILSSTFEMDEFQSTLPLRGATLDLTLASAGVDISIHTPLAGSDRPYTSSPKYSLLFQSTLPLRGATRFGEEGRAERQISIHTPLAGSDLAWRAENHRRNISIHTPLAGSDSGQHDLGAVHQISIHTPLAGSDALQRRAPETEMISIHTPLAGSDLVERVPSALILEFQSTLPLRRATIRCPFLARIPPDFNPHSPCGERHYSFHMLPNRL